ncbi:CopD family protein [Massilia agri]|uniref:Protoporphyrinogen IX oxidase n=1 Tax=Massilia agri TaxID=1886785 RepID=A0ABT2ASH6_9BURK|nr:CopD family protein [Massilia agri]MCS0599203.1 CopD family protein [Massilia agri]
MSYLLLKSLHVLAVMAFVSGLVMQAHVLRMYRSLPLPSMPDERRLLSRTRHWDRLVTVPALALTWTCGLAAALHAGWFASGWLKAKLAVVIVLSMLHGMQAGELRRLADAGTAAGAARGWPPALLYVLLACAVALAVCKPW